MSPEEKIEKVKIIFLERDTRKKELRDKHSHLDDDEWDELLEIGGSEQLQEIDQCCLEKIKEVIF